MHKHLPFHRIQKWGGKYFEKTSLKALGFRLQLGHPADGRCLLPERAHNDSFVVIDADGIHEIALDYCGCAQSIPKVTQLLRARLFPSTNTYPQTAATFRVLETFQMLSFTSKISGFEFYRALSQRTDNTGTETPPERYHAFMHMAREWRHVHLLKRFAHGHSSSGARGTQEGECAVVCPACPMPGVNLPENWKLHPQSDQWLYSLFIGIDANFQLKRMNVSDDHRDPGLNHGYAYLVEDSKYQAYLRQFGETMQDEKSSCHNHDAIKSANIRGGRGTAASGLGTVECSRHDMKRPTSVGDLQKGERYVNMDYFFLSSLRWNTLSRIVISYDIACQWSKKLVQRCSVYPDNPISNSQELDLLFVVPKFHLPAHVAICQIDYSFNLLPWVGRTDGEAPERGWSAANAVASSTSEMGPGNRRDTLDDMFGDYNWRKIMVIGVYFLRKAEEAMTARQEHVDAFIEFDVALPEESAVEWTKMCLAWEADQTKPNPFESKSKVLSDTEVRLQLAQDDQEDLAKDRVTSHFDITPGFFIYQGLEIEAQQQRLTLETAELGAHSTALQRAKVLERSNALRRRIEAWIQVQHFYVPGVALIRARLEANGGGKPVAVQDIDLFLPSQTHETVTYSLLFLRLEWQLRYAHAHTVLNDLRGQLLMRSMMYKSKERHSRGQRQQTRSTKLLGNVSAKINNTAERYRHIRTALVSLATPLVEVSWERELCVLQDSDLLGLTSLDDDGPEGRKKLKWIWTVQGTGANADASGADALRVEWCKARARAHRWQEECLLLQEEMRRVIATFKFQARWWHRIAQDSEQEALTSQQTIASLVELELKAGEIVREGKVAYAYRQAAIRKQIWRYCEDMWKGVSERLRAMEGINAQVLVEHRPVVPDVVSNTT
ncbi:hypothetical protein NLJ89_g5259 [Agrocybe chaxingu]|uniref:CxC2-like cysteine cluster KDZ transposase-associated domain-containing protein n=1 Tax=Agrocybe chaxingu TaxID=84603 RepID=A0A9W8MX23_9AGAR|nr:hypothetical protein NLJ89_g5259 [Agrocybe chaxingu]